VGPIVGGVLVYKVGFQSMTSSHCWWSTGLQSWVSINDISKYTALKEMETKVTICLQEAQTDKGEGSVAQASKLIAALKVSLEQNPLVA